MNLYIKVDHHPHCIWFLNLDSISLPQISSSLSATLQFLTAPLKDQDPVANAMFQAHEEARSLISVATEILYVPSNRKLNTKWSKTIFWCGLTERSGGRAGFIQDGIKDLVSFICALGLWGISIITWWVSLMVAKWTQQFQALYPHTTPSKVTERGLASRICSRKVMQLIAKASSQCPLMPL